MILHKVDIHQGDNDMYSWRVWEDNYYPVPLWTAQECRNVEVLSGGRLWKLL
jgi:hypothetical protein